MFLAIITVFLPLLGAACVGLSTRFISDKHAQYITSCLMLVSALAATILFYLVIFADNIYHVQLLRWFDSGDFQASWALYVDQLTAVMFVVVTWVSSLVHVYSIGYMSHDKHIPRFMSYLSLFTFFMLMLVSSDNFLQLFLGWEGVGLCSYFLIGFWFQRDSANKAAMKAFVVNRIGDFGFALGVLATYILFDSIVFQDIFPVVSEHTAKTLTIFGTEYNMITIICGLLFIGCMGKSAQLGLHTWLPDAMEGPTPVSALIHAATMVTAGVFLVARCSPMFEYAPLILNAITVIGGMTAIICCDCGHYTK